MPAFSVCSNETNVHKSTRGTREPASEKIDCRSEALVAAGAQKPQNKFNT